MVMWSPATGKSRATRILLGFLCLSFAGLLGCASRPHTNLAGPYWKDNDTKPIPEPEFEEPLLLWLSIQRSTFDQTLELLDLDRNVRKISGRMTPAMNVNCLDEVPNCTWFTNRHGPPSTRLSPTEIRLGPALTPGPDTVGQWTVYRPKVGGATPGFWIKDSRGDEYIIKFDPQGYPEQATAAAAMGSRYFHACGYNVPQETIVYWRPENLRIKEGTTFRDFSGNKREFTEDDLQDILSRVEIADDGGTIRSLASLSVGNVKGPFMYEGTRKGDLNDWCPHQHRRELRALYVIGSLINHWDMKDHNTMDVYVGENDQGYLKHYMMDFGSTFGSHGDGPQPPKTGYANTIDIREILVSTGTLGLKTWPYEYARPFEYPSIGYFESELFEPHEFAPIYPNPAFEQLTRQDGYWGAKIVMAFTDEDLAALVESGQLSNPEARAYLLKTLIERRDKIGRHWFGKVNPLDFPHVELGDDALYIEFVDLAVEYGLEQPDATYEYEIRYKENLLTADRCFGETRITLAGTQLEELATLLRRAEMNDDPEDSLVEVRVRTQRDAHPLTNPAVFWLAYDRSEGQFSIAGIEHL
jgi:hypothetical protein